MAKTDYKTIDQYHKAHPDEVVERMQLIRNAVHKVVPKVEEVISYQIPCFKHNGYLIYYSAYAKHISLSYPYSQAFLTHFKEELKNYKVSKSAIQFPHNDKLPIKLITQMVQFRKKENDAAPAKK